MDGNTQPTEQDQLPAPVQPGAMVTPNGPKGDGAAELPETPASPSPAPAAPDSPTLPATPETGPTVTSQQPIAAEAASPTGSPTGPTPAVSSEPSFYRPEDEMGSPEPSPALPDEGSSVSWTASEFVAHNKTAGWYALLAAFAVAAAAAIWLLTKDVFAATVIVIAVAILAGYAARKPRELQYVVDAHGITVGQRQFGYGSFRSFSVFDEGAFSSIELMPLKRFSPPISVYYDPKDEAAITDALARHLPFEPRQRDVLDRLMHKIRF